MISIVVMLILAGVSLNATVGDNGIIKRAQDAKRKNGIASLQEYVQQLYIQNYEEYSEYEGKRDTVFRNMYPEMFYSPHNDDNVGFKDYITYTTTNDSGETVTYEIYLFKKSGLPKDISSGLVGGDANGGGYSNYAGLIDVYGITTDLEVFYCEDGWETMSLIDTDVSFAKESQSTILYPTGSSSGMYSEILEELGLDSSANITLGDINSIKELTINNDISFKDFYNLSNLEILTIKNTHISSLNGIENANKLKRINFYNSTADNYTAINKLENKLTRFDIYCIDDAELTKMFTDMSSGNFSKLNYLAVSGSLEYLYSTNTNTSAGKSSKTITKTDMFNLLSNTTKSAVKYLSLQCNNIESLSGLINYNNVLTIRLNHNKITTLSGLDNMKSLITINCYGNLLGQNEADSAKNTSTDSLAILSKLTSLKTLDVRNNQIKWIDYVIRDNAYSGLYLEGITTFNVGSVSLIGNIFYKSSSATINSKYLKYLTTSEILDYSNKDLTDTSSEIQYLKNLSAEDKKKVKTLNLSGNSKLTNDTVNNLLKDFTGLIGLDVSGISNLSSIGFVSSLKSLQQIFLTDTAVTDLTPLNSLTTIKGIKINNDSIDLTKIQTTISRCMKYDSSASKYYTVGQNTIVGFQTSTIALYKQLEKCTNLTVFNDRSCTKTSSIDLSNLKSDINYTVWGGNTSYTLPNSIKYLELRNILKLNNSSITIDKLYMHSNGTECNSLLTKLKSGTNVNINNLVLQVCHGGNVTNVLNNAKSTNIKTLQVTHCGYQGTGIYIDNVESTLGQFENLTSLSLTWVDINTLKGIDRMTDLTTLTVSESRIYDLSPLTNLTKLTSVTLNDNMISKLVGLENLKSLQSLNLKNNSLVDTYVKKDENGKYVNYRNIDVLINLHPTKGGSLNSINIAGNLSLSNIDDLKALTWEKGLIY